MRAGALTAEGETSKKMLHKNLNKVSAFRHENRFERGEAWLCCDRCLAEFLFDLRAEL